MKSLVSDISPSSPAPSCSAAKKASKTIEAVDQAKSMEKATILMLSGLLRRSNQRFDINWLTLRMLAARSEVCATPPTNFYAKLQKDLTG